MVKGKLSRQLRNVGIVEAYFNKFESKGPASCFIGRYQIDRVWCTSGIVPTTVAMFTFQRGTWHYRLYITEFQVLSILGDLALPLSSPNERQLNCSSTIIVQLCVERVENQFNLHKISYSVEQLKENDHILDPLLREVFLNIIDELVIEFLTNAKKMSKLKNWWSRFLLRNSENW